MAFQLSITGQAARDVDDAGVGEGDHLVRLAEVGELVGEQDARLAVVALPEPPQVRKREALARKPVGACEPLLDQPDP